MSYIFYFYFVASLLIIFNDSDSDSVVFFIILFLFFPFSALTLLVGRQEWHQACKKTGCWFVGGDDLTGALHDDSSSGHHSPPPELQWSPLTTSRAPTKTS